jgi:glutathione peroxidase
MRRRNAPASRRSDEFGRIHTRRESRYGARRLDAGAGERSDMATGDTETGDAYQFEFVGLDGENLPLAAWRGRPVLVVNTASFCGYTPQYRDLEALWRRYRERGLVVLGVPSNDFGEQEPGTALEIKQFCDANYQVDFPLAEKNRVIGAAAHPFFRWVAATLGEAGAPRWNFHKYLIGRDGQLAGAWPAQVRPSDAAITAEIEGALATP